MGPGVWRGMVSGPTRSSAPAQSGLARPLSMCRWRTELHRSDSGRNAALSLPVSTWELAIDRFPEEWNTIVAVGHNDGLERSCRICGSSPHTFRLPGCQSFSCPSGPGLTGHWPRSRWRPGIQNNSKRANLASGVSLPYHLCFGCSRSQAQDRVD